MPSPNLFWANAKAAYRSDILQFREMSYLAGYGSPPHTHEQTHLIFFLKGTVRDVRKQQTTIRTPATLILIPPDERHATHFVENVHTFESVLSSSWAERMRQVSTFIERPLEYQDGPPTEIARRLYREFQTRDNVTPLILEGLMLEMLGQMARDPVSRTDNHCPNWLRQTRDFLHAHFAERVSLEAMAAEAGVHPSHLIRAFRQHFHCTIGDYVRELRVQQACHDLSCSDIPLSEIALTVGYSDQSHFTIAFKRKMGISPGEYRRIYHRR